MGKPTVVAIIPAKGVSTRLPGKNLKLLAGKPMLAYIIEAAKSAEGIDRVFVSTESREIADVAQQYGAEVIMRPVELTSDETTSQEVVSHALGELKKTGYQPNYSLLLYPTSPLLKKERIEEAIRIASERGSDSVISGTYDKGHYWIIEGEKWTRLYPKELKNSQYQASLFKENGALYLTKIPLLNDTIMTTDILVMDEDENIDVDYPEDFARAEARLRS